MDDLVNPQFQKFATWDDVMKFIREGRSGLWYHAPMDVAPTRVFVENTFKNGKIRFCSRSGSYTVDSSHLDRFCRKIA